MDNGYRRIRYILIVMAALLMTNLDIKAQGSDPGLVALLEVYKDKAQKMYKAQEGVMAIEATNHIWLESETSAIYDLQKEFNDYINTFRGVVTYAAQIYGFYYEIDKLVENMTVITAEIGQRPANPFAVALSARRNDIYIEIATTATGIINNVRHVCVGTKMTEKERIDLIFDIRPRLKKLNVQLKRLSKILKYTNMADVWREIQGRTHERNDKSAIIRQSFNDWRGNGRKIKPER